MYNKNRRLVLNSLFTSFSLCLAIVSHYLPVPFFSILKFDLSDIPSFMSALTFSPFDGAIVLLSVSFVKSFLFSSTGVYGFIMRMVNIVSIFLLGMHKSTERKISISLIFAIILPILIKLPLNYIFITKIYSMPEKIAKTTLLSIILPYNILKQIVNLALSIIFSKKFSKYLCK